MSRQGRWEYLNAIYPRYQEASRLEKRRILDEFCQVTRYHRKSALRLLNVKGDVGSKALCGTS